MRDTINPHTYEVHKGWLYQQWPVEQKIHDSFVSEYQYRSLLHLYDTAISEMLRAKMALAEANKKLDELTKIGVAP